MGMLPDINSKMDRDKQDVSAGILHSSLQHFHDKFLTSQLDIVTSDPGKALAWLVLVSTVITFLLGHLVYLALFGLLYITWLYGDNFSLNSRDRDGDQEEEEEEEWLLDRFFCFLQQLDNDTFDIEVSSLGEDTGRTVESETAEKREAASSAVSLQSADSSLSLAGGEGDLEDEEDFEFITT